MGRAQNIIHIQLKIIIYQIIIIIIIIFITLELRMGNQKRYSNMHRGKFIKRLTPQRWKKQDVSEKPPEEHTGYLEGSRIINLKLLSGFIKEISAHSVTCKQGCIMLAGERNREG